MEVIYFENLKTEVEKIWWQLPTSFDAFEVKYHKDKDLALRDLNVVLVNEINKMNDNFKNTTINEEVFNQVKTFAIDNLNIKKQSTDVLFNEHYIKYSEEFMDRAKAIDPTLTMSSVFQALRNVWTMHSMQLYLDKPVCLSDSVFAYSMLYPLTDNLLDDPNLTKDEKFDFNKRFRLKISTGKSQSKSKEEDNIFKMIDLIQLDWDREQHPKVYESLLAILDGQNLSLNQQQLKSMYAHDVLGISIYKGGTSVLADAYLVGGNLTPSQEKFAFYYGVILQFADDLQDIEEDLKSKHYTIMNIQSKFDKLDALFNKFLNLIEYFINEIYATDTDNQKALIELTKESIQLLIFSAVLKNKKLVSKELYKKIKLGSNFSPRAYNKSEKMFNRRLKKILDIY